MAAAATLVARTLKAAQRSSTLGARLGDLLELARNVTDLSSLGYSTTYVIEPLVVRSRFVAGDLTLSVAMFELGCGARMPPHNHPGMHVISLVLRGAIRVDSFSRAPDGTAQCTSSVLRRQGEAFALAPTPRHQTDIHQVTGVDPGGSIFIDWISPPYSSERECTYYEWVAHQPAAADPAGGETGHLVKLPGDPPEFRLLSGPYRGDPVRL